MVGFLCWENNMGYTDRLEFLVEENLTVVKSCGDYQLVNFTEEKYFMKGDGTITILSSSDYRDLIDIAINIEYGD